jgi:formylglycine-generating enzyme
MMLKKLRSIGLFFALAGAIVLMGCSGAGNDPAATDGDSEVYTIGDSETHTAGGESFTMIYAQDQASIIFPTGLYDDTPAILTNRFWMAETEVTNAVMIEVLQWAYDNGKFDESNSFISSSTAEYHDQQLLDLDDTDIKINYSGGSFSVDSGYEDHPVINVTWYGAIMFCNWLTEMRDGNDSNVVYTDIDTDWEDDETTENIARNGYRLPSTDEWEYAARYRGPDSTNTANGYSNPYFTQGESASGATADYHSATACQVVAVYHGQDPAPTEEASVKSLGPSSANELGLYDMSGNVREWCFTETVSNRRDNHGGMWSISAVGLIVSRLDYNEPYWASHGLGFRLCRTAD